MVTVILVCFIMHIPFALCAYDTASFLAGSDKHIYGGGAIQLIAVTDPFELYILHDCLLERNNDLVL